MKSILICYIQCFSGYDPDKLCVFPFKWEGVTYYRCTDFDEYDENEYDKVENENQITKLLLQHFDIYRISAPLK